MVPQQMEMAPQTVAAVIIRHEEHQAHRSIRAVRQQNELKAYHPVMMKTAPSMFKQKSKINKVNK